MSDQVGDLTPKEQNLSPAWQAGKSGNPAGRPKGARSKLSEAFIKALADDFAEHGIDALVAMRDEKPGDYIRVVASILPKQLVGDDDDGPIQVSIVRRMII